MSSFIAKLPNICVNIGRIVSNSKQAYVVNIVTTQTSQYLYSFGHTDVNKTTYDTLVKTPISIKHDFYDCNTNNSISRVYQPDELIYPILDNNITKYTIYNDDLIYYGFIYFGFTRKLIIIPKKK
jgi:hypothetical protein